jgi:hypothetical protein
VPARDSNHPGFVHTFQVGKDGATASATWPIMVVSRTTGYDVDVPPRMRATSAAASGAVAAAGQLTVHGRNRLLCLASARLVLAIDGVGRCHTTDVASRRAPRPGDTLLIEPDMRRRRARLRPPGTLGLSKHTEDPCLPVAIHDQLSHRRGRKFDPCIAHHRFRRSEALSPRSRTRPKIIL